MNLLSKIKNLIDELSNKPQEFDIDNIKSVLSLSYEAVRDGLNRSKNDAEYSELKKMFDTNLVDFEEINAKYNSLLKDFTQYEILSPFFEDLKNKLIGKINLISSYDNFYKENLSKEVLSAKPDNIVSLFHKIENDFNSNWNDDPKVNIVSKNKIDVKNYKIGGK